MNSFERVIGKIKGEKVDRIPNLNILMWFAARYAGKSYSDFILKPEAMVEANIKCHEDFGIDVVTTMSDPYCEAEDFGSMISYPYDDHPHCDKHILETYDDIKKLKVRSASEGKRMTDRLNTLSLYKQKLGNTVPIVGWVEGPLAEFADIYDINNAMMDLIMEPEWAEEVMDICTEQAVLFAIEQIEAGATIIGIGDAAVSIAGPEIYRNMVLERERKIVEAVRKAGGYTKLHICGDITPILEDIKTLKVDILDIDSMVDFKKANEILSGTTIVNGNLNPADHILNGNPEMIFNEVRKLVFSCDDNVMISGGCEIPRDTPYANLKAVHEALCSIQ